MIRRLFAGLIFITFSGAAYANSCPLLMGDIDEALGDAAIEQRLSQEQLAEVRQLRKQGEEAHSSGDHATAIEALSQAKVILGIS
jgi:hypothetical protein